jgi:Ring finger domain
VQDVLQYVQGQARTLCNPFEQGQRAYRAHFQPQQQPQINTNTVHIPVQSPTGPVGDSSGSPILLDSTGSIQDVTPIRQVRGFTINPPRIYRHYQSTRPYYTSIIDDLTNDENLIGGNPLSSLSNLINIAFNPSFGSMNDVVVVPTVAQVNNATSLVNNLDTSGPEDCAICQESMEENLRKINRCNHLFHRSCIETWFQSGVTCPICRIDIRE